ncbi:hypothetical protein PAAG_12014 [Paracoccidioides lutzii Pb01]|uniref:Uncharacterized protein n=1 Tax=Paracoccidioides lutzii (strain ATCC MYA-826 / Pb01) TaxID=502779 RepID=A0A0A2V0D7_PARBA|nr:hypothetical protein PAAG_12014 [Paracoccidioides lutzii Pb01]KGQ01246.1 hypothetical protein PAAG_12014 [Paracoccidioides lutzii Pb01]
MDFPWWVGGSPVIVSVVSRGRSQEQQAGFVLSPKAQGQRTLKQACICGAWVAATMQPTPLTVISLPVSEKGKERSVMVEDGVMCGWKCIFAKPSQYGFRMVATIAGLSLEVKVSYKLPRGSMDVVS